MDRSIIELPLDYFGLVASDLHLDLRGKSGQEGVTGNTQVIYGDQPRFVGTLATVTFDKTKSRAWRAVIGQGRGRINVFRIRLNDPLKPTVSQIGADALPADGVTHSDDATFSDGTGYSQSISAPIQTTAAAGGASVTIDGAYVGNALAGGEIVSINDWVHEVVQISGTGASTVLSLEPPLRQQVVAGDEVNFNPVGLFVLDTDVAGKLDLGLPHFGSAQLNIVEWVSQERTA